MFDAFDLKTIIKFLFKFITLPFIVIGFILYYLIKNA